MPALIVLLFAIAAIIVTAAMRDDRATGIAPGTGSKIDRHMGYLKGYGAAQLDLHVCAAIGPGDSPAFRSGVLSGWLAGQSPVDAH
jgi:hypothetical protein